MNKTPAKLRDRVAVIYHRARRIDAGRLRRRWRQLLTRLFVDRPQRSRDGLRSTYLPATSLDEQAFSPLAAAPEFAPARSAIQDLTLIAREAMAHRFDLLGSGWVVWDRDAPDCSADRSGDWLDSILPRASVAEAKQLWGLLDPAYRPIDWSLDARSGFRWSERTWFRDIEVIPRRGVDIKLPWELSRMQHLSALAYVFAFQPAGIDTSASELLKNEFRNQLIDFIATNPPRWGVNWRCTMDVAIRVSNWLVAWEIFVDAGAEFDPRFMNVFRRSVREHAQHIRHNLEWHPGERGNHYLADICGLLFCAVFLSATAETDEWLALAEQEFTQEVCEQFLEDGVHIERSTCYHLLCAQMVAESVALLGRVDPARWNRIRARHGAPLRHPRSKRIASPATDSTGRWCASSELSGRLVGMERFLRSVAGHAGRIPAIGDDDSGRFLKRAPVFHARDDGQPTHENSRDVTDVLATLEVLLPSPPVASDSNATEVSLTRFPEGGFIVYRAQDWELVLRCGAWHQRGREGHMHNDQLAFTLRVNDGDLIIDPGTFCYTSDPEMRDRFRSTRVHSTLQPIDVEQCPLVGLFSLEDRARAQVLEASSNRFLGVHQAFGLPCSREVRLTPGRLEFRDHCEAAFPGLIPLGLAANVSVEPIDESSMRLSSEGAPAVLVRIHGGSMSLSPYLASPGYGRQERTRCLSLHTTNGRIEWTIEFA